VCDEGGGRRLLQQLCARGLLLRENFFVVGTCNNWDFRAFSTFDDSEVGVFTKSGRALVHPYHRGRRRTRET